MKNILSTVLLVFISALVSLSCEKSEKIEMPDAQTLTRDASGYYCLMTVVYHKGPKGQIIMTDNKVNWFTSVRDTIAFTLLPEEPKNIAAIYVNDMSSAEWDNPGYDNWIDARNAWYVIGSNKTGGMGAPEAVPFSTQQQAEIFASKEGGSIYQFNDIPRSNILSNDG